MGNPIRLSDTMKDLLRQIAYSTAPGANRERM